MLKHLLLIISVFILASTSANIIAQHPDSILWSADWSPDDRYLAVGGADKILSVFDGESYELIKKDTLSDSVQRLRWHPHKNILAIAATGDGSSLIDFDSGNTIMLRGLEGAGTRAITWNNDGSKIAIADYEGYIHIWNADGKPLHSFRKENTKSFTGIDWHPNKDELIVISEFIRIYDLKGNLIKKYPNRKDFALLLCVEWHPDGTQYAVGDYGDYDHDYPPLLQFYDDQSILIYQTDISSAEYRNLRWNKDGSRLATSSDALRIWDRKGKLLYQSISESDLLWGLDWNATGTRIVTTSQNRSIKIWDEKAKLIRKIY